MNAPLTPTPFLLRKVEKNYNTVFKLLCVRELG